MHPTLLVAGLLIAACLPCLPAQQASYTVFAASTCAWPHTPHFAHRGSPRLGTTFVVEAPGTCWTTCNDGAQIGWVLTGVSNTQVGARALPVAIPGVCGDLLVSAEVWTVAPAGGEVVDVAFAIPNDARLLGLVLYQQVLLQVFSVQPWPMVRESLSAGARAVIGS